MYFIHAPACGKGIAHKPDAVGARFAEFALQNFTVLGFLVHAVYAHFQATQGFLEALLESAPQRHDFAHAFHLRSQVVVGNGEFFKGKTRHFGDNVINAGLKAGGGQAASHVVTQLIERVANGQLGRHFGDRKARSFGGKCRRTAHAGVHLNYDQATIGRVDGKLHV